MKAAQLVKDSLGKAVNFKECIIGGLAILSRKKWVSNKWINIE